MKRAMITRVKVPLWLGLRESGSYSEGGEVTEREPSKQRRTEGRVIENPFCDCAGPNKDRRASGQVKV
jgi:hypothetical protein